MSNYVLFIITNSEYVKDCETIFYIILDIYIYTAL